MATLTLMVGLPGSGKTTRAKELAERTGALRLTPDEWQTRLFDDDMHHPDHDRRHGEVEAIMWEVAARAVALGAACRVDFENVELSELERRIAARNRLPGGHFAIPIAVLRGWADLFEAPDDAEMAGRFSD